ncbi:type VI secretion system tip protein VgrG [Enterobacteriaceae bacterium ESL0689]|nr:type VI secretion system tip protein VgrG [Enterobacteriaceae bacterium ESL0689]
MINQPDLITPPLSALTAKGLNRYRLIIPSCPALLDVEEFSGRESLSELYRYTIQFTSDERNIDARQILNQGATLTMGTGPLLALNGQKRVHGVVTYFSRVGGSREQATYKIVLEPSLTRLDRQFRSHRFLVDKSVPEVVKAVLEEHGLQGWEYEFHLHRDYPKREQINQYRESDLAFTERLLAEVGIFYYFTLQPDTQTEVIHFADGQHAWRYGKKLPLNSPSGANDGGVESVWGVQVGHRMVARTVTTGDYSHREAQNILTSEAADMSRGEGEGMTYGDVYRYGTRHRERGAKISPATESGNFLAQLAHERFLAGQSAVSGSSSDAGLCPGQVLDISETVIPPTLPREAAGGVLITVADYSASRKNALRVEWRGIPFRDNRCWRPEEKARPVISGTLMARVTSAKSDDIYAWQDGSGLYRVQFDADRDEKSRGMESMLVRLAKPYGGDRYGFHFPLIQGTEVGVAFHEGDPDRPYIAHVLHDSRHEDPVTEANHTRNILRTAGLNKLRMEDKRGEEHIKLSTEYGGKTQLNLGHNVDASRRLRGEGAELRTDRHVAIRGGAGVFITADRQPQAGGMMLEMQPALNRLEQSANVMESLSADAQRAQAEPSQVEAQLAFMREQIEKLSAAVTLLSAPQGIALSSGKHLQLAADHNLICTAGKDADMGVMKRLFIGVGEGLSLFVRKVGMKLIANQGPVTVQAQNDQMQLLARKGLEIVSTDEEIHIVAKKKITLNAGGSYITLDPYCIELGTTGDFNVKSVDFSYSGPAKMDATHPDYPRLQETVKQSMYIDMLHAPDTAGLSLAGMPWTLYADGKEMKKGVLDSNGRVEIDHQVVTRRYQLKLANGVSYQIPVVEAYRNPEQGELANKGIPHYKSAATTDTDKYKLRNQYNAVLNDRTETNKEEKE